MSEAAAEAQGVVATLEPPGGVLMWLIVAVETLTFGGGLVAFTSSRRDEPLVFAAGRAALHQPLALANTLVLLTGGWCMARGLGSLRAGAPALASRWVGAAMASGLVFLALKCVEYADKLAHGLNLRRDAFFAYYWLLTSFHFLHVAVAVVLLAFARHSIRGGSSTQASHLGVESAGIFWHMCDVIWLLVYPTVYLLG